MSVEARDFLRSPVGIEAEISVAGSLLTATRTQNLSLSGLYVLCTEIPPVGAECEVSIRGNAGFQQHQVRARGRIARVDGRGFAVVFCEILGTESLDFLRRLVLWNATDPERAECEFHSHIGLKPQPQKP
jgi:hypothetical protein